MIELGYKLCSEEHGPNDLVRFARLAEDAGFAFAMITRGRGARGRARSCGA